MLDILFSIDHPCARHAVKLPRDSVSAENGCTCCILYLLITESGEMTG